MALPRLEVAHFFSGFSSLGGVQTVLRQHHERDSEWGLSSRFVITQEAAPAEPLPRVHFLPTSRWASIHGLTKSLRFLRQVPQPLVNIYHTIIPMRTYVCEHDCAGRRLLVIHGTGGDLPEQLSPRRTWLDGVISVSEEGRRIAQQVLPQMPAERFAVVPVPITSCPGPIQHAPMIGRPVILGYSGRLLKEHKRVDRLPKLCEHLRRLQVDYRLELLGDGPEQAWLEQRLRGNERVRFLGRKQGAEYLGQLATWDFVVLVSDTEGQPLSLLEAMSAGALPLFPRVGSAGDAYTEAVHPRLLYPRGDMAEAASRVADLSRQPEPEIQQLRARSISAVRPNVDGTYFARVAEFARAVLQSPRISTDQFPWHPAAFDRLPMSLASWIALQRRRWLLAGAKPS
jgi:glycosyltransferase involved in cell wall biosynthesis